MEVRNGQCFHCTQCFDGIVFIVIECFSLDLNSDICMEMLLLHYPQTKVLFMGFGALGPLKDGRYKEHIKF